MSPSNPERDGARLLLTGPLNAETVPSMPLANWSLAGVREIVLDQVPAIDSTGVALIAELVARIAANGPRPRILGQPPGLTELCLAYRIEPDFSDYPD